MGLRWRSRPEVNPGQVLLEALPFKPDQVDRPVKADLQLRVVLGRVCDQGGDQGGLLGVPSPEQLHPDAGRDQVRFGSEGDTRIAQPLLRVLEGGQGDLDRGDGAIQLWPPLPEQQAPPEAQRPR